MDSGQEPSTGSQPSEAAPPPASAELRQRKKAASGVTADPKPTAAAEDAASDSSSSDDDERKGADDGAKKTYGRTPDGRVFTVPTTHDMVSQLLDPRQPKNVSDALVLAMLVLHVLLARALPPALKVPVLAAVFVFWRGAYNIGIGWLLRAQSNHRSLVVWARRMKLFERPATNPHPRLYRFIERELMAKIPDADYDFATAPLEYNTWLVFRRLVDLILMCDFVSYCIFAVACAHAPAGETAALAVGRWAMGVALVGFNLWVKLDAHRVVKDYAWYWGDFFYLIDQELTFDGVFEMAPHPMYSIGYVGYYGISLMAASYEVLFISILAHLAQFAFLVVIENPHIEKTYNPPPPRQRGTSSSAAVAADSILDDATTASLLAVSGQSQQQQQHDHDHHHHHHHQQHKRLKPKPSTVHDLIGLSNLDLFRATDYSVLLLGLYLGVLTMATPPSKTWQALFYAHAVAWRLWTHVGLGVILRLQSRDKMWTRHFVKYGESTNEAWRQWKALCHTSTVMCHASMIAAVCKLYAVPDDWTSGWALLKHVGGAGLVALQMWTAASIYESLGEFGWFFGDFFFEHEAKLTYTSIYRFLNNPERLFGAAAAWGAALITWSRSMFALAFLAHGLQLAFLAWVEKPHMQRVFGRRLRQEAGLTKFLKRSLPPPVRGWGESVDRVLDDTTRFVHEFVESARPRFAAGVRTVVRDTSTLFNRAPARLTITQLPEGGEDGAVAQYEPQHYRLAVVAATEGGDEGSGGEGAGVVGASSSNDAGAPLSVAYGSVVRVRWTAPADHDKADWIGLYRVTDNRSRDVTDVSSQGRWAPTTAGTYDVVTADVSITRAERPVAAADAGEHRPAGPPLVTGEVEFAGDKLWWALGVYELRYHHGDSHTVMAVSRPFEVRINRFDVDDDGAALWDPSAGDSSSSAAALAWEYQRAVEAALLPLVQDCLDRDWDIAPTTAVEPLGSHVERDGKYARRVVYAVQHVFGVEFAPQVVPADGNVRRLAERVCKAKHVLATHNISKSHGAVTPVE